MNFKMWLETDNEIEWERLFNHCLQAIKGHGPFTDPRFHNNLIRLLRNVGLDDEANELELVRPSQADVETGASTRQYNRPGSPADDRARSFRAAHQAYRRHMDTIIELILQKAQDMGWEF